MAFIAQEPIGVSLAAIFCVGSWLGILYLGYIAIGSLVDAIGNSYQSKRIDGLAARFRWAYVDGLVATWLFFTIVISNFVLENSIANARYLIYSGWTLWLFGILAITGKIVWQRRSDRSEPRGQQRAR